MLFTLSDDEDHNGEPYSQFLRHEEGPAVDTSGRVEQEGGMFSGSNPWGYVAIAIIVVAVALIICNIALCCCSRYREYWRDTQTQNRVIYHNPIPDYSVDYHGDAAEQGQATATDVKATK